MKYIQNTGRYARAYAIEKNGQQILINLDRRRLFMDTGNVATTGITAIEDDDYELLQKNKAFIRDMKTKDFGLALIDESVALGDTDERTAVLEKENKELKKALEKAKKPEVKKLENDNKALTDENARLKAQLEALTAKKPVEDTKKADEEDEDEGF